MYVYLSVYIYNLNKKKYLKKKKNTLIIYYKKNFLLNKTHKHSSA